jgi:hypothetical protein
MKIAFPWSDEKRGATRRTFGKLLTAVSQEGKTVYWDTIQPDNMGLEGGYVKSIVAAKKKSDEYLQKTGWYLL